jgi:hypothetical protein
MPDKKLSPAQQELQAYFYAARQPIQSILFTLPVLILYEVGIFIFNKSEVQGVRNGADVLLRYFYSFFGLYGFYAFAASLILILGIGFWIEYRRHDRITFHGKYIPGMVFESLIYGILLYLILSKIASIDIQIGGQGPENIIQSLVLIFGAGIYEELLFRVILVSGIALFLISILNWQKNSAYIAGVILAALIFSWFHYIGEFGDIWQIRTFLLRAFGGVLLSVLYVARGFGIAVYAHIFYDCFILLGISMN